MNIKNTFLKHKDEIKYRDFYVDQSRFGKDDVKYTVLGIGNKAIKYRVNDGEDKFAYYDSWEAFHVMRTTLMSFDNECWNEDIREKIAAQAKYCKDNNFPNFSDDGFCTWCGHQMWNHISLERASTDHVTRCFCCSRSYLD